jgi:hypothetical protein
MIAAARKQIVGQPFTGSFSSIANLVREKLSRVSSKRCGDLLRPDRVKIKSPTAARAAGAPGYLLRGASGLQSR